jgi:hypothetical protein
MARKKEIAPLKPEGARAFLEAARGTGSRLCSSLPCTAVCG